MPKRRTRMIPNNGVYHGEGVFGDIASLLKRTGNKLVHAITLPFKRSKPSAPVSVVEQNSAPPIPPLPKMNFLDDIRKKPALRPSVQLPSKMPRKVVFSTPQDIIRNNPKFQTLANQRIDTNDDDEYDGEGRRRKRPFDFKLPVEKYKKRNRLHRTKPVKKTVDENELMKQLLHFLSFSKKGGRRRKMV